MPFSNDRNFVFLGMSSTNFRSTQIVNHQQKNLVILLFFNWAVVFNKNNKYIHGLHRKNHSSVSCEMVTTDKRNDRLECVMMINCWCQFNFFLSLKKRKNTKRAKKSFSLFVRCSMGKCVMCK